MCRFHRFLAWLLLLSAAVPAAADGGPEPLRLTVFGDSLSAGFGLAAAEAFPAQLERALRARGLTVTVINAGLSGDTSAGGRARLDWTLADRPALVIVELGGNDALRGLPPEETAANLDAILATLHRQGIQALLAGMRAPRNLGEEYCNRFDRLYPRLAERHGVPYYPFFLEGVAGNPALNLADGIHPNAAGIAEIVRRILPLVVKTIEGLEGQKSVSYLPPNAPPAP
jgi:acyl-CoA thioesterase-1